MCYENGKGVEKDYKQAVYNYRLASEQGDEYGYCNLGNCYEKGIGVEKDGGEAVRLYRLAAKANLSLGQTNLARCYELGIGVERDLKEALYYYQLACKQGPSTTTDALEKVHELQTQEASPSNETYDGPPGLISAIDEANGQDKERRESPRTNEHHL